MFIRFCLVKKLRYIAKCIGGKGSDGDWAAAICSGEPKTGSRDLQRDSGVEYRYGRDDLAGYLFYDKIGFSYRTYAAICISYAQPYGSWKRNDARDIAGMDTLRVNSMHHQAVKDLGRD